MNWHIQNRELVATGRSAIVTACCWLFQVLVYIYQLEGHILKMYQQFGRVGASDFRKWKVPGPKPMIVKVVFSWNMTGTWIFFAYPE